MALQDDAAKLREQWNAAALRDHIGKWIAFRDGRVESDEESLEAMLGRYKDDIAAGTAPLFAFVTFEIIQ